MSVSQVLVAEEPKSNYSLEAEAKRLLEFKKENIKKGHLTPCPQCASWVSVNANKCPHCTSEISKHTKKVREELGRLNEITNRLYELHKSQMELYQQEAGQKPFWQRIRDLFSEPQFLQDLKIVLPTLVSFFGLVLFLRSQGAGLLFWLVALAGGFTIYFLFKKWSLKKYVTVNLYRTLLVLGLLIILTNSLSVSGNFWPDLGLFGQSVEVSASAASVREAPSTNSGVVTTAYRGDDLTVLDKKGSWYKVRTESGKTGWIHTTLVD
jgi:hypothetical protein